MQAKLFKVQKMHKREIEIQGLGEGAINSKVGSRFLAQWWTNSTLIAKPNHILQIVMLPGTKGLNASKNLKSSHVPTIFH